jgi:polyhydroxyalkanoate synthesis regulator protein
MASLVRRSSATPSGLSRRFYYDRFFGNLHAPVSAHAPASKDDLEALKDQLSARQQKIDTLAKS